MMTGLVSEDARRRMIADISLLEAHVWCVVNTWVGLSPCRARVCVCVSASTIASTLLGRAAVELVLTDVYRYGTWVVVVVVVASINREYE